MKIQTANKLVLILIVSLLSFSASAATYTYSGNTFTDIDSSGSPPDLYTTADRLTGSITFGTALASNLVDALVSPLAFSFNDGVNTLAESTSSYSEIYLTTDGTGTIVSWYINVINWPIIAGAKPWKDIETAYYQGTADIYDRVGDAYCSTSSAMNSCTFQGGGAFRQEASNSLNQGTWTVSNVPIPAAAWLFGSALVGLFGIKRKK